MTLHWRSRSNKAEVTPPATPTQHYLEYDCAADGTRAAAAGNGDLGTSQFCAALRTSRCLSVFVHLGHSGVKHNGGRKIRASSMPGRWRIEKAPPGRSPTAPISRVALPVGDCCASLPHRVGSAPGGGGWVAHRKKRIAAGWAPANQPTFP